MPVAPTNHRIPRSDAPPGTTGAGRARWKPSSAAWAFAFFVASGVCGLVYQVVWLRLTMARFGVNAPVASTVLSTFMAGVGIGSYLGGRLARRTMRGPGLPLVLYGVAELIIAASAILVPMQAAWGHRQLNAIGQGGVAWGSAGYFLLSGTVILFMLLPWCVCMGATFPLMIAALRQRGVPEQATLFSYLYQANVMGAAVGTLVSAFVLIELLGLNGVLRAAAVLNLLIGAAALWIARGAGASHAAPAEEAGAPAPMPARRHSSSSLGLLFVTGAASMALEVIWLRLFLPYLGTVVYVFAIVLALYLVSSAAGTMRYRAMASAGRRPGDAVLWLSLAVCALIPLAAADPRLALAPALRVVLGVVPFCYIVGFVTPALVDRSSGGDAERVGRAYAVNVLGSVVGPLVAGFGMLPLLGERSSLVVVPAPLLVVGVVLALSSSGEAPGAGRRALTAGIATALCAVLASTTHTFTDDLPAPKRLLRDYEATSVAHGEGRKRGLLINGVGITELTPITKMMAHLPLAELGHPPRNVLIVAFGMGTTFRSALSWNVATTVVDLVPSVPALFGFFHDDADSLQALPTARIVVDDGRRFLERTPEQFDVIIIDPPPPAQAIGSSLLYSADFYAVLRRRLSPGGILAQWYPGSADPVIQSSVTRSVMESFPHVRSFESMEGWGVHLLASDSPIQVRTAAELAGALPASAGRDMIEWSPAFSLTAQFSAVLEREVQPAALVAAAPAPALTDDRPVNEYYFVRTSMPTLWRWWYSTLLSDSVPARHAASRIR